MQFKPITAIIVLSLVVASLLIAGCTTPTPVNQTTSPPTKSVDIAGKLNSAFAAKNFTIITPFTRAVNQYGNVVYTGVVKDGENTLVQYVHNLSIEETKNRNETLERFDAYVAQALTQGYSQEYNTSNVWHGVIGNGANPAKEVYVEIVEPNVGVMWDMGHLYLSIQEPNYRVTVDYTTKV
jgi:sugar phosphate isomerase/epimerase